MTGTTRNTTVNKQAFIFWADFIRRGTMAQNVATGETKQISFSGYVHKDLTVRKAIASKFGLPTFRK